MKFSLDRYSNTPAVVETPEWATSTTKKILYINVCAAFDRINNEIEAGTNLGIKDRKIVARLVAKESGVHDSLLNKRRQPEIHELITQKNNELEDLWNSHLATKYSSGKKRTKQVIQGELRSHAAEIDRLTNLRLAEALTKAIESQMVDSSRTLIATIEHLKAENAELALRNGELSKQLRAMMKTLNTINNK
jgi:hypothetical protein